MGSGRFVHGRGRTMEERGYAATVCNEQPDGFAVRREVAVPVFVAAAGHGEVQDVIEVRREIAKVGGGKVAHDAGDARLLEPLSFSRCREAGDAPHLVASRERERDRQSDLPGRTSDEDAFAAEAGSRGCAHCPFRAGRKVGTLTPSRTSRHMSSTSMPMCTSEGRTSTMSPTSRTPPVSGSSTTTGMYGTDPRTSGKSGCQATV